VFSVLGTKKERNWGRRSGPSSGSCLPKGEAIECAEGKLSTRPVKCEKAFFLKQDRHGETGSTLVRDASQNTASVKSEGEENGDE